MDILTTNIWQVWGALAVLLLVVEMLSSTFYVICFSIGALATMIVALLGGGTYAQLASFALFSLLSILLVRPMVIKWLHKDKDGGERPSNADALISREAVVSQTIEPNGYGRVAIDGDDWKAKSVDGRAIEKGSRVIVRDRESIILQVEQL